MSSMSQIASDLYKYLTESDNRKPKAYDVQAEVLRIDGTTVWVKIPGGIDETPVSKTNNAKEGDQVMVRISGGKAWVLGNETNPATDDTVANTAMAQSNDAFEAANVAQAAAGIAQESADKAVSSAFIAQESARQAIISADTAQDSANQAINNAVIASNSAASANESATSATYHLSEIEQVIDVLSWISQHGTYTLTNDQTIVSGKWYFEKTSDNAYVVSSPELNPHSEGFYELSNVDSAITNYISTHIYLDDEGLNVRMDADQGAKLKITGTGIFLINQLGETIAQYSNSIVLGNPDSFHIELSPTHGLGFYQTSKEEDPYGNPTNRVAYIQYDRLFIQSATLTNNLQIGNFRWVVLEHRISLKYNPV